MALNVISIVWIALISIALLMPPSELVLWTTVIICVFMVIYWQVDVKKRFFGPKATAEEELRRIEADLAKAASAAD